MKRIQTLGLAALALLLLSQNAVLANDDGGVAVDVSGSSPAIHMAIDGATVVAYPAFEDYTHMLFDICDALGIGIETGCDIYPMNADIGGNAIATVQSGNKVIVYDRQLSSIVGSDGALMLIAHELAHHYCGHLQRRDFPHLLELEADAFAGGIMQRMGRPLDSALSVLPLFSERPSRTHPPTRMRVDAIKAG